MSRDETVLLVSRAIAVIQFVTAFLEASYLPERFLALHHYSPVDTFAPGPGYLESLYRLQIGLLFGRIAGLLLVSWLFWTCGPRIGRLLLPSGKDERSPSVAE